VSAALLAAKRRGAPCMAGGWTSLWPSGGPQGAFRGPSGGLQGALRGPSGGLQGAFRGPLRALPVEPGDAQGPPAERPGGDVL
jgi:hypothetical protein